MTGRSPLATHLRLISQLLLSTAFSLSSSSFSFSLSSSSPSSLSFSYSSFLAFPPLVKYSGEGVEIVGNFSCFFSLLLLVLLFLSIFFSPLPFSVFRFVVVVMCLPFLPFRSFLLCECVCVPLLL